MRGRSNSNRSKKNKRKHTYHYSVITMVHKSAGSALDSFQHVKADGFRSYVRPNLDSVRPNLDVYSLSRFGLTEDQFFLFQIFTIMLLLRATAAGPP